MFHVLRNIATSKGVLLSLGTLGGGGVAFAVVKDSLALNASGLQLHAPSYPWPHGGVLNAFDHASIRRGYFVYKQVCAACHSMEFMRYRHMIDVCMTEEEAKTEAEETLVTDGPDDQGNMFERKGKLNDSFPFPYPNDEAAKAANNGAVPPDLSLIALAREGGLDYIFSLLTSYVDAPAGVEPDEGQSFNPYMAGGTIAMAQQLFSEGIDYDDGTPATISQQAKDVSVFLKWAAEQYYDDSRRLGIKILMLSAFLIPAVFYYKRLIWAPLKTRQIAVKPRRKPKSST